jgi:hypothetical protein
MKTVREVSKELGVSRQTIYSKLTDNFKKKFTTTKIVNGKETLVINNDGVDYLKNMVDKPDSQADSQTDSKFDYQLDNELIGLLTDTIEILQRQLEVKDIQIMELNKRLEEAQELNRNNQILLHRQQEPKMIEAKGESEEKKSLWFKNLFKGN